MKVVNGKIIAKTMSKKGSTLVSVYRDAEHLVDNCVLVNPLNLEINVNKNVDGDIIFNTHCLNTFILTSIK